ncbi:hypothetical protein MLD38_001027 [Melastoma candidum]|uniref:Uncharacterized protein n=1 Tax=Melastoma candidum TaxID=119954 RepID=A0ACB9SBU8_9MYRT|nr:hypothetical protein MLD38_001027 [Melastoma candidum]
MDDPQAQNLDRRRSDALGDLRVLPDQVICSILENLSPRDVCRLSCVSSVMYILCNEEPLWMSLCLKCANGLLQYKGSWKRTTLHLENVPLEKIHFLQKPLQCPGFNSLFLYKRFYRCHTTLDGFYMDSGNVKREKDISLEEFYRIYDGIQPVLLTELASTWPARNLWTIDQLSLNYGDKAFRISQQSANKVSMKLGDYISYAKVQCDEDPLYIFDDKFAEVAPGLLKDYSVPHLFKEDFFDVLDDEQRPPFRWLIIGPERSGASWHVDPALTSAWNTLLSGRKRWALYPPGKVPLGVTVHVSDENGDVHVDTPTSLQWWLDYYPLLAEEDKPIECTQLPGETIYVPTGWWHCVLNLETTVAVTQNYANSKNFEFVCLDLAPGYRHKGVCRAGMLAINEEIPAATDFGEEDYSDYLNSTRKEKRLKVQSGFDGETGTNKHLKSYNLWKDGFSYDINFLSKFLDEDRDHYNYPWSAGNCIGQREMREWLFKLWTQKPDLRELIWKGACIALGADKWLECLKVVCNFHKLPSAVDSERLPVGTGSNPVYLVDDYAVKIFVEGGLENAIYGLGTELEFYCLLAKVGFPLRSYVPEILASGILYIENGSYIVEPWDGREVPDIIHRHCLIPRKCSEDGFAYSIWDKKLLEYKRAEMPVDESSCARQNPRIWPYVITKRCKGKIFAELRDTLSWEDRLNLSSFLGERLHDLHLLPLPALNSEALLNFLIPEESQDDNHHNQVHSMGIEASPEWDIFFRTLSKKKVDVSRRLNQWGHPIPSALIQKVDEYIADDLMKLLFPSKDNVRIDWKPSWIHTDIMDDNIHMEPCSRHTCCNGDAGNKASISDKGDKDERGSLWRPSHIIDFSDLSVGDPLYDLIPIHLDIFRGDASLLKQFLQSYKLPLVRPIIYNGLEEDVKYRRLSYRAMCYCILHEENVLGAIFSIWKELRQAQSWEEVEQTVWGELNTYSC